LKALKLIDVRAHLKLFQVVGFFCFVEERNALLFFGEISVGAVLEY